MKQLRVIPFSVAVALALSGCGLFGGSDGTDVAIAESQPTPNVVQQIPVEADPTAGAEGTPAAAGVPLPTAIALPTAMALPTAAPTVEPTPDRSQPTSYIVQSGDVLGLIAEQFDVPIADLREANDLDGNLIRVGQELIIPAVGSSESAGAAPAPTHASSGSGSGSGSSSGSSGSGSSGGSSAATVSCSGSASGHCIQPGESLTGIALKYDVSVDALRAANPGITGDLIRSGQVLNLPGDGGGSAPSTGDGSGSTGGSGTGGTAGTGSPTNDAECAAKNPAFPFFHASDGLCYANPIGATPVPTVAGGGNTTCPAGRFLFTDGLCYPIPGVTVTAVPNTTPRPGTTPFVEDYGRPPCDTWEVVLGKQPLLARRQRDRRSDRTRPSRRIRFVAYRNTHPEALIAALIR